MEFDHTTGPALEFSVEGEIRIARVNEMLNSRAYEIDEEDYRLWIYQLFKGELHGISAKDADNYYKESWSFSAPFNRPYCDVSTVDVNNLGVFMHPEEFLVYFDDVTPESLEKYVNYVKTLVKLEAACE